MASSGIAFPNIDPVALDLGPVQIHWYGVMYLLAYLLVWALGSYRAAQPKSGWTKEAVSDVLFYGFVGVVLGGRVGYVLFYNLDSFLSNPLILFHIHKGGMSFHGGFLGVLAAYWVYTRQKNRGYFEVADFFAPLIPIGLGLGRMGNFINGELWGRATDVAWGVVFPRAPGDLPRHPSQLYEFFLEGLLLFVVLWFYSKRQVPKMAVSALFVGLYGTFRFIVEYFREPDAHLGFIFFKFSMGQLLSLPMILVGFGVLIYAYRRQN